MATAQEIIDRFKRLAGERSNFDSFWQSLHNYFYVEASDHNRSYAPGNELDFTHLYDATSLEAADVLASGFMNYLTPPTSKWFRLKAKDPLLQTNKEIGAYLEDVSSEVMFALNRSNFYDQCFPAYKSSGVYGTSIIIEEQDPRSDIRFTNLPLSKCCIVEDATGRVAEYFVEFDFTNYQAVSKWGDAVHKTVMEEFKSRPEKSHKYLLYVGYRSARDISRDDKANMPIAALWIDQENKVLVETSGYLEFPMMCHRFDKRMSIPWGFSPGMKCLPFARVLNAVAKTNLRSMMKRTDPPIALPDNAFVMPFNGNPRALNYYNKKYIQSQNDIFAFANYGDPQFGTQAVEYYAQKVKAMMFNDAFLAFTGVTKQMNNPEISERINEKMTLLAPAVGRWISEVVNPIVIRTLGILFRLGKLPEPPDAFLQRPEYEIECMSQLAQAQRRSELGNIVSAMGVIGQLAPLMPDMMDKISSDRLVEEVWDVTGSNVKILRTDGEIDELREGRAQQQAAQMQAEKGKVNSESNRNNAQAQMAMAEE